MQLRLPVGWDILILSVPPTEVFRTRLNTYELKIGVNHLKLVLPAGGGVVGEMRLPLPYNLQLSFDINGMATTKAVDFDGVDISDEVKVGGFYEMILYDETLSRVQTTKLPSFTAQGQAVAHNYDIKEFVGGRAYYISQFDGMH